MASGFSLKYDGLETRDHVIEMRRFGEALVGTDKVVNYGLVALLEYRLPRRGERFPLVVKAKEPREGSVELVALLQPVAATLLPLVPEVFYNGAGEIIWRWISWVLNMSGGREKEAEPHFKELMILTKEIHKGRAESEEKNHEFLLKVLDKVTHGARGMVAPVGQSSDELIIRASENKTAKFKTVIDIPMAGAIRSKDKLIVGYMEKLEVKVDGLIHHNRQLKIEHPEIDGKYMTAVVKDPMFDEPDNVYTKAVATKGLLEINAKPSRKEDGTLHALYIMDAISK